MVKKTNPNGANQYQLDPRQKMLWDYYIDPNSETFSNAYKSALKAGYTDSSSLTITDEYWFTEKVRTLNMLDKAERVLNDMLEMEHQEDVSRMKLKQDTAKFVASTSPKYSAKSDVSSGGKPIPTLIQIIKPNQDVPSDTIVSEEPEV